MSDAPETPATDAADALRALPAFQVDPELREWSAPTGTLATPAGLTASFTALGMRCVADARADGTWFEAWRTPRVSGAILAASLGAGLFLALSALGVRPFGIGVAVIVAAFYVPIAVLPTYRVHGRIAGGRCQLRLTSRGLFARPAAFERRLRFYLERAA